MSTFNQKLSISLGSAALFALVNLPQVYKVTDSILPINLFNKETMCPTNVGLLTHALVFFALTFLSMRGAGYVSDGVKLKHSLYGTLIFYLISSPAMYSLVGSIFGSSVASSAGCPTVMGVVLHSLVFCAALVGVMYLP